MRYTIATAVALVLAACSESDSIYADISETRYQPELYVVGYAYGHLPAEGDTPAQDYNGDVVVVVGPVPYSEGECRARALSHENGVNSRAAAEGVNFEMRVRCEHHRERPNVPEGVFVEE